MMNIFEIKDHVFQLEQKGKRMPVFAYLKKAWDSDTPSESLTVLVMQQMVDYLDFLESPWGVYEDENEYYFYLDFLHEAIMHGLEKYKECKMFSWQLCFYLTAWGTYHFIHCEQIPPGSAPQVLHHLLSTAKSLYPNSALYDFIPLLQDCDDSWKSKMSDAAKASIRMEIDEWNLRNNMVDQELKDMFSFALK